MGKEHSDHNFEASMSIRKLVFVRNAPERVATSPHARLKTECKRFSRIGFMLVLGHRGSQCIQQQVGKEHSDHNFEASVSTRKLFFVRNAPETVAPSPHARLKTECKRFSHLGFALLAGGFVFRNGFSSSWGRSTPITTSKRQCPPVNCFS